MAIIPNTDIVVVDWRNLVQNLSHSIRSASIALAYPTEAEEISHRIMKHLFILRADAPYAKIVFAVDSKPYWRESFLLKWYSDRKLEPVIYKGNRANLSWQFVMQPQEMEQLYRIMLEHGAKSIGAMVIQDSGLEADDIFGVIAKAYNGTVLGISADTDWSQLISDRVFVYNFTIGEMMEYKDIRVKIIGGDSGDNVKGIPKLKKDGTLAAHGWGQLGASKLLAEHPDDWHVGLDADHLERNYQIVTLPCPDWDAKQAMLGLNEVTTVYSQTDEFLSRYGVTLPVRKALDSKAARDAWVAKLRIHILEANKPSLQKEE